MVTGDFLFRGVILFRNTPEHIRPWGQVTLPGIEEIALAITPGSGMSILAQFAAADLERGRKQTSKALSSRLL